MRSYKLHTRLNGKLDRRYTSSLEAERRRIMNLLLAEAVLVFIGVIILGVSLLRATDKSPPNESPKPVGMTLQPKSVKVVEAMEIPCDYDPITYLRCRGEQLGINAYTITKIIATMKCESGLRPDAINKNTNGTFDIGVGQINDVHNKRISRADRMDFKKNIDFIYKLYLEQGLNPWVCARKLGFIK